MMFFVLHVSLLIGPMANLVSFDDAEVPIYGLFDDANCHHMMHMCVLFCLHRCDLVMLKEKFSRIDAEQEWRQKHRQLEMEACCKALAVLNSDDAHDLFTKTLDAAFVQTSMTSPLRCTLVLQKRCRVVVWLPLPCMYVWMPSRRSRRSLMTWLRLFSRDRLHRLPQQLQFEVCSVLLSCVLLVM